MVTDEDSRGRQLLVSFATFSLLNNQMIRLKYIFYFRTQIKSFYLSLFYKRLSFTELKVYINLNKINFDLKVRSMKEFKVQLIRVIVLFLILISRNYSQIMEI